MGAFQSKHVVLQASAFVLLVATCGAGDSVAHKPAPAASQQEMERWWADLEEPEPDASRALLQLAGRPKQVVGFLKSRLRPLKLSEKELGELLDRLASDEQEVWEAAFEELDYLDPRLAIDLEVLMDQVDAAPARQRIVALMSGQPAGLLEGKEITLRRISGDGYNFRAEGSWWAEHKVARLNTAYSNPKKKWTRAVRAMMLLQHIGTPEAIALLEEMATGHPDAQPTRVAREALEELRTQLDFRERPARKSRS